MTKAKKETTDVAVKPQNAVATFNYGDDAGSGFETTTQSDLSIPFLSILQALSPVVTEGEIEGAKVGQLYNTVTKELIDGSAGINFLPCHKENAYVEWVPRSSGGGFVALHEASSDVVKAAIAAAGGKKNSKLVLENGNELIETYYMYGLVLNEEGNESTGFAVLSFTSTKIKPYRDWTTSMYTLKGKPPLFANRAVIKTTKQKNDHGTFYNFRVEPLKSTWVESLINPVEENALLQEAKGFREMVTSGLAKADFNSEKAASGGDDAATVGADGIPF